MTKKSTMILIILAFVFFQFIIFLDTASSSKKASKLLLENKATEHKQDNSKLQKEDSKSVNESEISAEQKNKDLKSEPEDEAETAVIDKKYKEELVKASQNVLKIENLNSIMGPDEIKHFVQKYNAKPSIYNPISQNFRANLHMHTTASDGSMAQEELLQRASEYANKIEKKVYVAITDHNTTEGIKNALMLINTQPQKYKNIKVILGMEVDSKYKSINTKEPVDVHLLVLGINPYDKELNTLFNKSNFDNNNNNLELYFSDAIKLLKRKGFVGIAHPAKYVDSQNLISSYDEYYKNLFSDYKDLNQNNLLFIEGYYQSYQKDAELKLMRLIRNISSSMDIFSTGSTDSHGHSIFKR